MCVNFVPVFRQLMFIEVHLHFSQLIIFFRLEWKRILFLQAVVFADSFMPADDELNLFFVGWKSPQISSH